MYKMIKLPYSYNDFNGYLSSENLRNHYEVLYKGYVDNFNKVLNDLQMARDSNNYDNIKCLEKNLAFQGSGAILHTLFFENITPYKKGMPDYIRNKIISDFDSLENFNNHFIKNITNIEGGGWGILGYNKALNKLLILQCEKHQNLTIWDFEPLLVIDIWEHAYYLDYITDKGMYASRMMELIDWEVVNKRYLKNIEGQRFLGYY